MKVLNILITLVFGLFLILTTATSSANSIVGSAGAPKNDRSSKSINTRKSSQTPSPRLKDPYSSAGGTSCTGKFNESSTKLWTETPDLVNWVIDQRKRWMKYHPNDGVTFPEYLRDIFAPNEAKSAFNCRVDSLCSPLTCDVFLGPRNWAEITDFDREAAFHTMEFIANFNNFYHSVHLACINTKAQISGMIPNLNKMFTYRDEEQLMTKQETLELHLKTHAILTVVLTVVGAITPFDPISAVVKSVLSAGAGLWAGASAIFLDLNSDTADGYITDNLISMSAYYEKVSNDINEKVLDRIQRVINGKTIGSGQHPFDIVDFMKEGFYAVPTKVLPKDLSDKTLSTLLSGLLDTYWKIDRSYITRSLVDHRKFESCREDDPVPPSTKVCLDEDPDHVYQVVFLNAGEEKRPPKWWRAEHASQTREIPGWEQLKGQDGYYNITQWDVVRSSIDHYRNFKFESLGELNGENIIAYTADYLQRTGKSNLFSLPVCECPCGECITGDFNKDMNNYPCMCGYFYWSIYSEKTCPVILPGLTLETDRTPEFMDAAGFSSSPMFGRYCREVMECEFQQNAFTSCKTGTSAKNFGSFWEDVKEFFSGKKSQPKADGSSWVVGFFGDI